MKKRKLPIGRKYSFTCNVFSTLGIVLIGFCTFVVMRMLTMDTTMTSESIYALPEFSSIENFYALGNGAYAIAVDGNTLTGKKSQEIRPTASTAKMILGLAIMQEKPFELGESGEKITITENDRKLYEDYIEKNGSVSGVEVGEEISEYDALMSVFLVSSNNMADTLALWAFGSMENYQNYATDMLKNWGINNTNIGVDASGFDASTTSTPSDLARIAAHVMQSPVLKEIVGTAKYTVPVAGELENTNKILGQEGINGVKTGFIGEESGYCLASAYPTGKQVVTVALLGASTREESFEDSLGIVKTAQEKIPLRQLVSAGETVGYYNSWWTGQVAITASEDLYGIGWADAETKISLDMNGQTGVLNIEIGNQKYSVPVAAVSYDPAPSIWDRLRHVFGWANTTAIDDTDMGIADAVDVESETNIADTGQLSDEVDVGNSDLQPVTNASSDNCTIQYGNLMLINPNFTVENDFIAARRSELVSISSLYGIAEGNPGNGDNLLDAEAAMHINDMVKAYEAEYPGHTLETRSCFRSVGTKCGRLCAATGASDHHTGLTCDLLDPAYGTELDADDYAKHVDWQWLKANSYKYGFVDRFPEAWAGGPMSEPLNVDENGSTGLYETWHYRYVGIPAANDIAFGKYNNGEYDSLEHYLKARGLVQNLKSGTCK